MPPRVEMTPGLSCAETATVAISRMIMQANFFICANVRRFIGLLFLCSVFPYPLCEVEVVAYENQVQTRQVACFCLRQCFCLNKIQTRHCRKQKRRQILTAFVLDFHSSGYRDSNPGLPTPEAGALTGLRYTPNSNRAHKSNRIFLLFQTSPDFFSLRGNITAPKSYDPDFCNNSYTPKVNYYTKEEARCWKTLFSCGC